MTLGSHGITDQVSVGLSGVSPLDRYQHDLAHGFYADPAQARAIEKIQALYHAVIEPPAQGRWLQRIYRRLSGLPSTSVKGLYLWGGVGRGKTYLMDCFHDCLPIKAKRRVHFHRFMDDVHERLKRQAGESDPLITVARQLAAELRVLCLDEFYVADIADAMILATLLEQLFGAGVTVMATSNSAPKDLYRDGLQRAKFLPAIDLIERHCQVLNVDGHADYRLRILERAEIYHVPLDQAAQASLQASFEQLAPGDYRRHCVIHINQREIPAVAVADGIAWFEFSTLCDSPRSTSDYIELARRFNTVLLANVPQMKEEMNDPARRFIHLVDEFYDRNVNLIIAAEVEVDALYLGQRLAFEFRRTRSRLIEMQSHDYLAREHQP